MSKKLPPLPPLRVQTGIPLVGLGRSKRMNDESSQLDEYPLQSSFRPYYGSSASVGDQQRSIAVQNQQKWLGSHFMPFQIHSQSNAAGPNRLQYGRNTRQTLGNHEDDDSPIGPYRAVTYKARFFGKDVDIVSLEGGPAPYSLPEADHEEATYFFGAENHPEFRIVPDSEVTLAPGGGPNTVSVTNRNILADDYLPNLGDAPYGNYPDIGSRIHFIDWDDQQERSPRRTILKDPEVQLHSLRYDPDFYSGIHKARKSGLTSHVMGTFSAAGGVASGFAKRANFYPIYHNSWSDKLDPLKRILHWHKNKDRNPDIKYGEGDDLTKGVRNPTILIFEFHSDNQKHFFIPVERIASLTHAGRTTNRPAGGWGTNLQPFVDMHQIPYRIEDPENAGTWYWAVSVGRGGSMLPGFGENVKYKKMMETLWDEGIVLCVTAGNSSQVFAKRDDAEHSGSYFVTDPNSKYYANNYNSPHQQIESHDVITSGSNGDTFYPFRAEGPSGCKRDKSIDIAAGQLSETNRALDSYSSRGPGIDIIGTGSGEFSASAQTEFPADTNLGSGSYLDPAANEFVAGTDWSGYQLHPVYNDDDYAYPFEDGQELVISDLGTSSSAVADWNAYLGYGTVPAGSFETRRTYEITNLGSGTSSQNQDRWNTFLGRTSVAAGEYLNPWGSGIRFEIVNLGSGTDSENQTRWNEYFGNNLNSPTTYSVGDQFISTGSFKESSHIVGAVVKGAYQVGDTFRTQYHDGGNVLGATAVRSIYAGMHFSKPASSQNSLIPSNAKVQTPGWKYGYFSGTSCAAPTVAGKIACMMEEYLHTNERWPTPNEAKNMLISQAKHYDISATSTYWGRVPPPAGPENFTMSSLKFNKKERNRLDFDTKRPDFQTLTGRCEADSTGWRPVNTPSTTGVTINPSSIGEIDGKTVIASSSTNGKFQDGSGNEVFVGIGNKIVIGGGQSDLDDGTYTVKSITKPFGVSNKVFIVDRYIAEDQNGVPTSVTNFPSATFALTRIQVTESFPVARLEYINRSITEDAFGKGPFTGLLENEAGQGPAGMSCNISIYKRDDVEFGYDPVEQTHQTRSGKVEIDVSAIKGAVNIKVGTSDGDGTFLDYNSCIATGTITPGEALTSVTQVATHSGNKMSSTDIYDQTQHNIRKLDGTGDESSRHRDRKTVGYRFSADSAVPHNNPTQIDNESSPDLTEYNNVVGTNLYNDRYFDIKYQSGSAESIYETKKPFTAHSKVAWKWYNYPNSGVMNNQTMGSLSSTTFNDASGTSRTVRDLWWSEGQGEWRHPDVLAERPDHFYPQSDKGVLCFSLNGTNIPNTDNTFGSLEINGISFDRNTAYYSADSNGNTVWWWDLGCYPYIESDFFKLNYYQHPQTGVGPIIWALNASHGNRVIFDTDDIPLGTGRSDPNNKYTYVKLTISNVNPTVGYKSYIDNVTFLPETWWHDNCIVHTLQNAESWRSGWSQYDFSEPCGTPPLWAHYDGRGVNLSNLDSLTDEETPTEGAIYPNNAQSIVAINEPVVSAKVSRVRGKRFIGTGLKPENENTVDSSMEHGDWEREERDTDGRHNHDRDPNNDF